MNRMFAAVTRPQIIADCAVLLGVADEISGRLLSEIEGVIPRQSVETASSLERVRELCRHASPSAIVLDVQLFGAAPLNDQLTEFVNKAPVILFGGSKRQTEFARLLASDRLDFVGRCGDFTPLVVNLLQRRLRSSEPARNVTAAPWPGASSDIAAIFRHEVNNPLTGILGNAELVLAHCDGVSSIDKQRLQTVVDLAVRLRETIRRISNSIENGHSSAQSA